MATISGGDKLEKALARIAASASNPGTLRVGFLENATYPAGSGAKKGSTKAAKSKAPASGAVSVALVAATNEYGRPAAGQPPRPFFRNMIKKNSGSWSGSLASKLRHTSYDGKAALDLMGDEIKGQLQQSITDLVSPKLAESTVAAKGFSKPLIDTSHMLNSVDYDVK